MNHAPLLATHLIGALLLGAAVVALWIADARIRRARDCGTIARAGRRAGWVAQRVLMPGVALLAITGVWLVASYYGGWNFVRIPWLAGMAAIFVFQSAWARAVTHPHAAHMRSLLAGTRDADPVTPALERARRKPLVRFGQQFEPALFVLAVALGLLRPMHWTSVVTGAIAAALVAAALAFYAARPPAFNSFNRDSVEAEGSR